MSSSGMYFDKPFGIRVYADGTEIASICSDALDRVVYCSIDCEPVVFEDFFHGVDALQKLSSDIDTARQWADNIEVCSIDGDSTDIYALMERFHNDRHEWGECNFVSYSHWFLS